MNQIKNLVGIEFENLTAAQLLEVMFFYADTNNYPVNYELDFKNKIDINNYFERNFYSIDILESFFNFWTK